MVSVLKQLGVCMAILFLFTICAVARQCQAESVPWGSETKTQWFLYMGAKPTDVPPLHPDTIKLQEITYDMDKIQAEAILLKDSNGKMESYISKINTDKLELLDYTKIPYPRYLIDLMQRMSYSHGIEPRLIYPLICYESKFDPLCRALTSKEDSRGLLQVNIFGRHDVNPNKLYDAAYNLDYQLDELKTYKQLGEQKGLKGAQLSIFISKYGQRPQWKTWIEDSIKQNYKQYCDALVKA